MTGWDWLVRDPLDWQSRGQGFKSPQLHSQKPRSTWGFALVVGDLPDDGFGESPLKVRGSPLCESPLREPRANTDSALKDAILLVKRQS